MKKEVLNLFLIIFGFSFLACLKSCGEGKDPVISNTLQITQIASHRESTCVIMDNASTDTNEGLVKCWGRNTQGELGLGNTRNKGAAANQMGANLSFVDLGTNLVATQITNGDNFTCVLLDNLSTSTEDGLVKCWGTGSFGVLGYGNTNNIGVESEEMGDYLGTVSLGTNLKATYISSGDTHTCVVLDNESTTDTHDGLVKCWGRNNKGQLGLGNTNDKGDGSSEMGDNLPLVDLGSNLKATAVETGSEMSCAILDNTSTTDVVEGLIKCWGEGGAGRLGQGSTADRGDASNEMGDNLAFTELGTNLKATLLSIGYQFACAKLDNLSTSVDDGLLKCWGNGSNGRLGSGATDNIGTSIDHMGDNLSVVNLGTNLKTINFSVSGFSYHSCAILDNTSTDNIEAILKCWGSNSSGQLGIGNSTSFGNSANKIGDFIATTNLGTGFNPSLLSGGYDFFCAVGDNSSTSTTESLVKCWGSGVYGVTGHGIQINYGDDPNEMGDYLPFTEVQ